MHNTDSRKEIIDMFVTLLGLDEEETMALVSIILTAFDNSRKDQGGGGMSPDDIPCGSSRIQIDYRISQSTDAALCSGVSIASHICGPIQIAIVAVLSALSRYVKEVIGGNDNDVFLELADIVQTRFGVHLGDIVVLDASTRHGDIH